MGGMEIDPAALRIVLYPHPVLKRRADEVDPTPGLGAISRRMIELMRGADGIGLAAPQVGLAMRLFVAHVPGEGEDTGAAGGAVDEARSWNAEPEVYVNPVIEAFEGFPTLMAEGCLSLPGISGEVPRPPTVRMSWTDLQGRRQTGRASGLLGRCWQHELDHLDGVLILDRMTEPSRVKMRPTVKALERGYRPR